MDGLCNLFVYGTLMSSASSALGTEQRRRLGHESVSLGAAVVQGKIYDLGGYPGVILTDGGPGVVHGELIKLHDPEAALSWLDPYEDVSPGGGPADLYRRIVTVALAGSGRIPCWIYELSGTSAGPLQALPDGRWPAMATNPTGELRRG